MKMSEKNQYIFHFKKLFKKKRERKKGRDRQCVIMLRILISLVRSHLQMFPDKYKPQQKDLFVSAEEQKMLHHRTCKNLVSCTNKRQRAGDQDGYSHRLM